VKRKAPIRVITFFLLAGCRTFCQELPSSELLGGLQFHDSAPREEQSTEMREWKSLPNALSSIQPAIKAEGFHAFAKGGAGVLCGTEQGQAVPGSQTGLTNLYQMEFIHKEPSVILSKYVYPQFLQHEQRYLPSASGSFIGRSSHAASSIFIARDGSGRARLNTSYFLGVLTSIAAQGANRPPRSRSASTTFNNVGSTIGSDVGINVYHEFGPGIRQVIKGLAPKFVSRIEERMVRNRLPKDAAPIRARNWVP